VAYFEAKMHLIRFRLRLRSRAHAGAYAAPPIPWLDFTGLLLRKRGRGGESTVYRRGMGREE